MLVWLELSFFCVVLFWCGMSFCCLLVCKSVCLCACLFVCLFACLFDRLFALVCFGIMPRWFAVLLFVGLFA